MTTNNAQGRKKILFVCVHNSARSQMAEAFANSYGGGDAIAMSAGLERGVLNPYVVTAMRELGYDLSQNTTKGVVETNMRHGPFDYVITVCDESDGARCPVFPMKGGERLHWSFEDPSKFRGTDEEILAQVRVVRDAIKLRVREWCRMLRSVR